MISYADLERIYRLEKDSPVLQGMPDKFYSEAIQLAQDPQLSQQKNNIIQLLSEIYDRRKAKLILYALRSMKDALPDNTTREEEKLYLDVVSLLKENRERIFRPAESNKQNQDIEVRKTKIKILKPMPSLMASDLREYGPYNGNETIEIPEDNAKILISQGIAEEIKSG